jgi:hypothetical protein
MRKYFILLGIVILMTASLNAQYFIKQAPLVTGGTLTFDAVLYFHFTIKNSAWSDSINWGIHLIPTDSLRVVGDYSCQFRYRSRIRYNANYFDCRDQLNKTGMAVGSYACIDTVRHDTTAGRLVGYNVWFNIKLWKPGSDSVSRYDVFLKKDASTKLDTIIIGASFRNNPKPPFLANWTSTSYDVLLSNISVTSYSIVDNVGDKPTSVKDINLSPTKFDLSQNYPNPFNPETRIQFGLPERGYVRLSVYNLLGQFVSVLVNGELPAGTKEVAWNGMDQNGRNVTSGVYFYKLETPQGAVTRKMILVK